ncbi:MAG: hypothetical protein COB78_05855 [Hyphomicrobiales bacterium]|nr:MAG: hypothetical protein COB78_05855 [Hyphomicrobiales bacterium]
MGKEQTEPDFAKIVRVDGQQVLFYIEPCGDKATLHRIVGVRECFVDLEITRIEPDVVDDVFKKQANERTAKSLIETACAMIDRLSMNADNEGDSQ